MYLEDPWFQNYHIRYEEALQSETKLHAPIYSPNRYSEEHVFLSSFLSFSRNVRIKKPESTYHDLAVNFNFLNLQVSSPVVHRDVARALYVDRISATGPELKTSGHGASFAELLE